MIRTARLTGITLIVLAGFGTAAGIAAMGETRDPGLTLAPRVQISSALPATAAGPPVAQAPGVCDVTLQLGSAIAPAQNQATPVEMTMKPNEAMSLDISGSSGLSVVCGSGFSSDTPTSEPMPEIALAKADGIAGF